MPYREKVAWLSLLAMAAVFVPYFTLTRLQPPDDTLPNLGQMARYAVTCGAWLAILGVGHWLLRRATPDEARLPMDERDVAIAHRARSRSYGVLVAGMILVGCVMPFTSSGWSIVNAAILMIVLAEAAFDASVVLAYRRQGG
jgi:hypothetical protein